MTVERRLDPETSRQLQPLWDYLAISAQPISADAIFVFGSLDFAVPDRAAELYHAGHAPRVLVTGSYGRLTRDVFPKPEALVFKDRLVAAGVPPDVVVTEDKAANTLENVRSGMDALRLRCLGQPSASGSQGFRDAPMRGDVRWAVRRADRGAVSSTDRARSEPRSERVRLLGPPGLGGRSSRTLCRQGGYSSRRNTRWSWLFAERWVLPRRGAGFEKRSSAVSPTSDSRRRAPPLENPFTSARGRARRARLLAGRQRWSARCEERLPETARRRRC